MWGEPKTRQSDSQGLMPLDSVDWWLRDAPVVFRQFGLQHHAQPAPFVIPEALPVDEPVAQPEHRRHGRMVSERGS